MIDYLKQKQIESELDFAKTHSIAKIGAVYSDGVSLIFAGQTEASQKHYPRNKAVTFNAGDKVLITKVSGTYVVICAIA